MSEEIKSELLEQARARVAGRLQAGEAEYPLMSRLLEAGAQVLAQGMAEEGIKRFSPPSIPKPVPNLPPVQIDKVAANVQLPALPQVAMELQRVIQDQHSSASDIARIIKIDPSLVTILLHLVNSALYGLPTRIDTVDRAVAVLGTHQVYTMAIGNLVLMMARESPPEGMDHLAFWAHSIACAVAARELALLSGTTDPERAFVSGLLHDIGRLALFSSVPLHARQAKQICLTRGLSWHQAEQEVLGFDHARIGAMLLRKWDLPYSIVSPVADHHSPENMEKNAAAAVIHVADVFSRTISNNPDELSPIPALYRPAWERLGLSLECLDGLLEDLAAKTNETMSILLK